MFFFFLYPVKITSFNTKHEANLGAAPSIYRRCSSYQSTLQEHYKTLHDMAGRSMYTPRYDLVFVVAHGEHNQAIGAARSDMTLVSLKGCSRAGQRVSYTHSRNTTTLFYAGGFSSTTEGGAPPSLTPGSTYCTGAVGQQPSNSSKK